MFHCIDQLMEPDWWPRAKQHLLQSDAVIAGFIRDYQGESLHSRGRLVETLMRSIVGQQISVKAAATVWSRLQDLMGGEVSAAAVSSKSGEALQACGLSWRKTEYIQGIAAESSALENLNWNTLSDEQAKARLCELKGVGAWTAEMVLIFSLLRPDVFPLGDLGVVRAIERLYNDGGSLSVQELTKLAQPWRPYASAACWYLWRSIDPEPVDY